MKTTEHNITGTILRAGTGTEGRVTVEIETTREQLRDFPFNMIGKGVIAFVADSAPKPETPIPDDDGWIEHRPGDAMPCDPSLRVYIKMRCGEIEKHDAEWVQWCDASQSEDLLLEGEVIAWKPA